MSTPSIGVPSESSPPPVRKDIKQPKTEAEEKMLTAISQFPFGGGTTTEKGTIGVAETIKGKTVEEWDKERVSERRSQELVYSNVIKRLPDNIKKRIRKFSEDIPRGRMDESVKKVRDMPWDPENPMFHSNIHYYYALEALRRGEITQHQFGTLMLFKEELDNQKAIEITPEVIPIFDTNGSPNKEALDLIEQGMYPPPDSFEKAWDIEAYEQEKKKHKPYLDENQSKAFFEFLSKTPKSEQQFLLVPEDYMNKEDSEEYNKTVPATVSMAIQYQIGFNVFGRVLIKNEETGKHELYRIIPSVGMMQAFLDAIKGKRTIYLDIVLGPCTGDDLDEDTRSKTRKVGVHFDGCRQSSEADRYPALGNDFPLHDGYHAWRALWIPDEHKLEFSKAGHLLDDLQSKPGPNYLRESFFDMEFDKYYPEDTPTYPEALIMAYGMHEPVKYVDQHIFWYSLAQKCEIAKAQVEGFPDDDMQTVYTRFVKYFAIDEKGKDSGITGEGLESLGGEISQHSSESDKVNSKILDSLTKMHKIYLDLKQKKVTS